MTSRTVLQILHCNSIAPSSTLSFSSASQRSILAHTPTGADEPFLSDNYSLQFNEEVLSSCSPNHRSDSGSNTSDTHRNGFGYTIDRGVNDGRVGAGGLSSFHGAGCDMPAIQKEGCVQSGGNETVDCNRHANDRQRSPDVEVGEEEAGTALGLPASDTTGQGLGLASAGAENRVDRDRAVMCGGGAGGAVSEPLDVPWEEFTSLLHQGRRGGTGE